MGEKLLTKKEILQMFNLKPTNPKRKEIFDKLPKYQFGDVCGFILACLRDKLPIAWSIVKRLVGLKYYYSVL